MESGEWSKKKHEFLFQEKIIFNLTKTKRKTE